MSVPRAAVAAQSIGAAFKGEASRALAARSVHVKIFPRVRNIHESCQILRQLQEFGDVEFYKNLAVTYTYLSFHSLLLSYNQCLSRTLIESNKLMFTATNRMIQTIQLSTPHESYSPTPPPQKGRSMPSQ